MIRLAICDLLLELLYCSDMFSEYSKDPECIESAKKFQQALVDHEVVPRCLVSLLFELS